MITIDGSMGEGGGQIVRTALSLAAVTTTPVHLEQIRAERSRPGLAPQHLTAVRALANVCNADVTGDELRSSTLTFRPTTLPQPGAYLFDVAEAASNGSAGSVTLILQSLYGPLVLAGGESWVTLRGGTHVAWSPSFHYVRDVFLPAVTPMGGRVECELERYGFYPAGQGEITVRISGIDRSLQPQELTQRGELERVQGTAVAANLPDHIPKRMVGRTAERLEELDAPVDLQTTTEPSAGPGAGICLTALYKYARAGITSLGERGKPSEAVADEAAEALFRYHVHGAPVDRHLADQLLLPMALADGTSRLRTTHITSHVRTNADVIRQLLDVTIDIDASSNVTGMITVDGAGINI